MRHRTNRGIVSALKGCRKYREVGPVVDGCRVAGAETNGARQSASVRASESLAKKLYLDDVRYE